MIKAKIYIFLFFALGIFFAPCVKAQDDSLFSFLTKMEYPISSFAVDNIGELYVINIDNQLKKYNEKRDSTGVFNEVKKYGKLSYVEAQNPWKTILFYQNFATIVLLDKYLKVLGNINLRSKNIFQVKAVTSSYDNNIWLYDEQDNKLKKIDDNGNLLLETVDFRLLFDSVPTPQKLVDKDGFIYLYDPQKGVYIFDYYGSFKQKLSFLYWADIAVIDNNIYGFDKEYLYKYTPPLPEVKEYKLPQALQNSQSIKLNNHKIYILKDQQLQIYSLH